ncbi:unnamed protein product [Leptosia nina]|uniref:Uncharacterized protein n=1 Tax=Leptosia nina TaxID=320188 RepID=A0AAV1JV02_9NEOP
MRGLFTKNLDKSKCPALTAQSLFEQVSRELFGTVGAPRVDILHSKNSQVIVRVEPLLLRKFRAALALSTQRIHVCREAPSLQALL